MSSIDSTYSLDYKTRTEGLTKIITILWNVPKFSILQNKQLRTESMDPADLSESRLQLKMKILGRDNAIVEIYYLSLTPVSLKSYVINSVYNHKEYVHKQQKELIEEHHTVQANKWQYLTTLFKHQIALNEDSYIKPCMDGNSFKLKLEFMLFKVNDIKVAELSNDFENLLNNGLFSDVTIKSADLVEYKVHKVVLASRSAVVKAHFEHNTTECYTNVVDSPLQSEVLREVLTFIYSEKAPRVDEIPEKWLAAADYYQLSRLKSLCEEALHKKLTVENAIETLQLADLHSANALKQLTVEFIKDGQAQLITKTDGWSKLKSVELIKRIYEYIVADDIEDIDACK